MYFPSNNHPFHGPGIGCLASYIAYPFLPGRSGDSPDNRSVRSVRSVAPVAPSQGGWMGLRSTQGAEGSGTTTVVGGQFLKAWHDDE